LLDGGWRIYLDRRVLTVAALGFASGLPLLLTFSTLTAWLKIDGVSRSSIGLFALVGIPYSLKFLWAPIIDRVPFPFLSKKLGRRRGWGIGIQLLLILAILALGASSPVDNLTRVAALALLVAFLSASQDIVIDAYRVEILTPTLQGPGAGAVQAGYRIAMLVAGAGALYLAQGFGWFVAYAVMAMGLLVGLIILLIRPEPGIVLILQQLGFLASLRFAVLEPFKDFASRQGWVWMLVFTVIYKLGEAMAGFMANPLYVELGFSLDEIATISKVFGFVATITGAIVGGLLTARFGVNRSGQSCLCVASAIRPRHSSFGFMCGGRKLYRRHGRGGAGRLAIGAVQPGFYRDPICPALVAVIPRPHHLQLQFWLARRHLGLGRFLFINHRHDPASLVAPPA
jgi:MFS transporter, PAT family, beta-lactamase induction signal transducer AmpG